MTFHKSLKDFIRSFNLVIGPAYIPMVLALVTVSYFAESFANFATGVFWGFVVTRIVYKIREIRRGYGV